LSAKESVDREAAARINSGIVKGNVAFMVLVMVVLFGVAACSDDDGDEGGESGSTEATSTTAPSRSEPILIKTRLDPVNVEGETTGEVRSGSTIGDSVFCAGGTFADAPREASSRSVMRAFRCPDGTLWISFVSTPPDVAQRSDWEVVRAFGRFEGLSGGGRMRGVSESGSGEGRETFTGTVSR
jgi:hypothetical protein